MPRDTVWTALRKANLQYPMKNHGCSPWLSTKQIYLAWEGKWVSTRCFTVRIVSMIFRIRRGGSRFKPRFEMRMHHRVFENTNVTTLIILWSSSQASLLVPKKTLGRPHCLSKQTNHSLGYIGRRVLREQRYSSSSPKSIRIQSSDVFVSRIIWPPTQEIHWIRSKLWTFENRQSGATWYPGFFFHFEKGWRNPRYWEMETKNRSL